MANKAKGGTPEEFTATVAQYVARWTGVIEKLGIGAVTANFRRPIPIGRYGLGA